MNANWKETDGDVAEVEIIQGRNGVSYSVVFTYKVDGEWYGGTFLSYSDPYQKGDSIAVRYDPENPERNDWVQKETRRKWFIGVGLGLLVLLLLWARFS